MIGIVSCLDEVCPMQKWHPPEGGFKTYPPSVLIIGDSPSTPQLKQRLENDGCQVYRIDIAFGHSLTIARQNYFDVVVLNLERLDVNEVAIYKKLKMDPVLAHIPVVVLSTHDHIETIKGVNGNKVYYLPRLQENAENAGVEAKLLQIVEQIHYLNYRYM